MVNFIKRDKNDIYSKTIVGFLFKNQKFIMTLKIVIALIFFYAIYFGFTHPDKDNTFTWAVFWGIFWSLFMVATLPTLGRVFCGICPHGFLGKYITKFGLKKKMPKWMQNPYIGVFILVIGWWGIYYMFPGIYRTPFGTAMMFSVMTLLAFIIYFIYRDMSYCKYICPIGTLTRAYGKLSFTWLGSYKSACNECKTFECATACQHNLKPFTFDSRNSMTDCTLCMDCSAACEAISFKVKKPSFSLFSKFQILKAEVWTFILILAAIPISMAFHHGIGRSKVAGDMIWAKTAEYLKGYIDFGAVDAVGLFAFIYAIFFTIIAATLGMYVASKILQKDFKKVFYDLGYSYAPLFILGSLAHTLESFFTRGYDKIIEGFALGFGFGKIDVASLASRGDKWLAIFGILKWVAIIWALIILYKRIKLLDSTKMRKILAFPFAAFLIIFFISVNAYRAYILDTYGRASSGMHGMHSSSAKVFQTVPQDQATILQSGRNKNACTTCGMSLVKFYKANHAAKHENATKQFCSIHCLAKEKSIKHTVLDDILVVDFKTLKFIDTKNAHYVLGSKKRGVMTKESKFAFASQKDSLAFMKKNGGKIVSFDEAYASAVKDFRRNNLSKNIKPLDTIYFSEKKPSLKSQISHGGGHMMGARNRAEVPTKKIWLVTDSITSSKCVKNITGNFFTTDIDNNIIESKINKNICTSASFQMPKSGYYKVYSLLESKNSINVAKYEFKRFDHSSDEKYNKEKMAAKSIKEIPFDILRLRNDEETFYSHLHSGEVIKFKVLKNGVAQSDVKVSLETQFGWQKNVITNQEGIATIQLIQDYLPPWDKFNKRFKEKFLVVAQYSEENRSYKVSYSSTFRPSKEAYQSYSYALVITILMIILLSGAIFLYRYRVQKPFKEVSFND